VNENDLLKIERGTYRESMKDGLTEFLLGIVLCVIPGLMLKSYFVPIFVVFYIIFLPQGIEAFRRKYTYPRTGYVKFREEKTPKLTLGVAAAVLLAFITIIAILYSLSIGVIDRYFIWKWLPTVFGVIMVGPSLYLRDKTGQNRYYLWGVLTTISGLAVSLAPFISAEVSLAVYMFSWGSVFMVLGIIRFVIFIRNNPVIDTPEDDSGEQ
jgi:uncharacterized membrane protein HdeD (DUF308 family)